MTNFKDETIKAVGDLEVWWVGSADGVYVSTWEQFLPLADVEYSSGYGGQEAPGDLVVVFVDGSWLSRGVYDGSEWWVHNLIPQPQDVGKRLAVVIGRDEYGVITGGSVAEHHAGKRDY